jgi:hypothetical protein
MQRFGWPLLNDTYYPELKPVQPDDYPKPLQLLAQKLQFIDPITKQARSFSSNTELSLDQLVHSPYTVLYVVGRSNYIGRSVCALPTLAAPSI